MGHTGKALSRTATQLPLTALSLSLQAWERSRPLREFALRRSNEALQIAAHTPLGRLLPKQIFDDGADEEAAGIVADARQAVTPQVATPEPPQSAPSAVRPEVPARRRSRPPRQAAAASKPRPAPKPDNRAARAVGAPGAVTEEVEQIAEKLARRSARQPRRAADSGLRQHLDRVAARPAAAADRRAAGDPARVGAGTRQPAQRDHDPRQPDRQAGYG